MKSGLVTGTSNISDACLPPCKGVTVTERGSSGVLHRPKLLILACGGTISSARSANEVGASPQIGADRLVADIPELAAIADVQTQTVSMLASPDMTFEEVLKLHRTIEDARAQDPDLTGVIITHGTDTLEEVAFALDLLWRHELPVVVTGAMRNASLPGPDGPANLIAAAHTAASPATRGLGVLVVLNDQIHAARFVRKSNTANVATFQSPWLGPIGYLAESQARIVMRPTLRQPLTDIPTSMADTAVALVKMSLGDDGRILSYLAQAGFGGVVIEGFGGGHVTREVAESAAFAELLADMPVVLASRAGAGEPLRATYSGFAGSETEMMQRGAISSGILDGPKARVLLTLLLATKTEPVKIRQAFGVQGLYCDPVPLGQELKTVE